MEFLRPPSAKAVTCSTACMGIRQIRLGLNRGQQNAKSKLSDAQRAEIACRRAAGESAAALASEFGVGTSQIYKVANTVAS